eukprot:Gb_40724 [translate_table: standard]
MQTASVLTVRNTLIISARKVSMLSSSATKLSRGNMWVSSAPQQKSNGKLPTSNIAINNHSLSLKPVGPMNDGRSQCRLFQSNKSLSIPAAAEQACNEGNPHEDSISSLVVVSFYKFADFPDHAEMRCSLRDICEELHVSGGIILAPEGINGSICGTRKSVEKVLEFIQANDRLKGLRQTESPVSPEEEAIHHGHSSKSPLGAGEDAPFRWDHVLVKLKKEVVSMGVPGISPAKKVGKYVNPKDWNALISDPDTLQMVVDVRNSYETRIGKFRGAVDPNTTAFREFLSWVEERLFMFQSSEVTLGGDQKPSVQADPVDDIDEKGKQQMAFGKGQTPCRVAMYCTGGIRCEKATSLIMSKALKRCITCKEESLEVFGRSSTIREPLGR